MPALAGCYSYRLVPTTPAPGVELSLELNDLGRYQLGDHLGQGVARIEGLLVSLVDSQYTLRAERTIGLAGNTMPWNGEQVTVSTAYVSLARERRFSPSRTIVLAGVFAAGFAVVAGQSLLGSGFGSGDQKSGGTSAN